MTELNTVWVSVDVYNSTEVFIGVFKEKTSALTDLKESVSEVGGNPDDILVENNKYTYDDNDEHVFFAERRPLMN